MIKIGRLVLLFAVVFVFFLMLGGQKLFQSREYAQKEYRYIGLFSEVAALIRSEYVEEIDPAKKFPGAYSAMLGALDKSSTYLDKTNTRLYSLFQENKICSTGIHGSVSDDYFVVTDVDSDSPAQEAGVKPGELIKGVQGESIFGLSFWEMQLSLVTEQPKDLEIILLKEKTPTPLKVNLRTRPLPPDQPGLHFSQPEPGALWIRLTRFNPTEAAALEAKLTALANAPPSAPPLNLILDLRKYSGGSFEGFKQIAALFFKTPVPLVLKTKEGSSTIELGSEISHKLPINYKIAVIINPSTRMYSELLAGLFKTFRPDAKLVGSSTRGIVSQLKQIPLSDGSSIVITEGLFMLAEDKPADTGVAPHITIKLGEAGDIVRRCCNELNHKPDGKKDAQTRKTET